MVRLPRRFTGRVLAASFVSVAVLAGSAFTSIANAATTNPPKVTTSATSLGLGNSAVFSTVYNEPRAGQQLKLTNSGTAAITVTSLKFSGTNATDFVLCPGQLTSFTIAKGGSAAVCVQYRPKVDSASKGTQTSAATLTVASTSSSVATTTAISLGGLNTQNYESFHEPSLQQIVNALGYKDNIGVTNWPQQNSTSATNAAIGDEVLSPYWKALNASASVQLLPIAHYSGKDANNTQPFGWYAKGSSTTHNLYALPGGANGANDGYGQNQLLLPTTTSCSGCANTTSFKPGGSFGLTDNYPGFASFSDDSMNEGHWHNYRFYAAKDSSGKVIPGEYIVGDDVAGPANNSAKNWDYQDFDFLLINATPDTTTKPIAAGAMTKSLSFDSSTSGISGSGFTTSLGTSTASKVSVSGGNLNVTTSNDSNSVHTNALDMSINAGDAFTVSSQLVGPFTAIDAGSEQQGIFFGSNATNYVKAEVEWNPTTKSRNVTLYKFVNGTGTIVKTVKLPTTAVNTIDFYMDVNSSPQEGSLYNGNPVVTVNYVLNGNWDSGYGTLGSTTISGSWITQNSLAGIMTSYSGGSSFVAEYNSFGVDRKYDA